jgi:acetoin utilization protein AcuB
MFNLLSPVKEIMSSTLITIDEYTPLSKVEEIFKNHKIHHIPVVENGELIGMISKSDFLLFQRGYMAGNPKFEEFRLKSHAAHEIMTKKLATLKVDDRIDVALEIFKENLFHAIPIMENEILAGIVTTYDVIKALAESNGAVNKYPTEV